MIRSMTGYGRGESTVDGRTFIVEIKTVNHRYNDISVRSPKILNSLEPRIIKLIKQHIFRGKVDVYITYNDFGLNDKKLILDEKLTEEYLSIINKIKDKFFIDEPIGLSLITRFPDIIKIEDINGNEDELWNVLSQALEQAITQVIEMREKEGTALKNNIIKKLNNIKELLISIEKKSGKVVEEYRNKLKTRINELLQDTIIDEQRLATEVAILADKSNITEEITRLHSHIEQMFNTLDNDVAGKKLNFILQEMQREANTISSKVAEISIINDVLEIRNEIEEIREQIQNIE